MKPTEAVPIAKDYLRELFKEEQIVNLGLEEIEYDEQDRVWNVTLGFSRPWDRPRPSASALAAALAGIGEREDRPIRREYRIVRVRDEDGEAISIRLRDLAA